MYRKKPIEEFPGGKSTGSLATAGPVLLRTKKIIPVLNKYG
jgi:hypothetical protein